MINKFQRIGEKVAETIYLHAQASNYVNRIQLTPGG